MNVVASSTGTQAISAEVRWFLHGEVPPAVLSWFGNDSDAEERSDRYLILADATSGSVKLRRYLAESWNLEVKLIRGAIADIEVGTDVRGIAQEWVKWSFGAAPVQPLVEHLLAASTGGYVDVEKKRYLQKFAVEDGAIERRGNDERPERGCNYELTQILVGKDRWWTICFESFGSAATVRMDLDAVARSVLRKAPPPVPLNRTASLAYPDWLASQRLRQQG